MLQGLLLASLWFWLPFASLALADEAAPTLEYQVKASMIYNFLQFVEWPPELLPASSDVSICVLGEDKFGAALNALTNELVRGRKIRVVRLKHLTDSSVCHVLFVSGSEPGRMASVIQPQIDRSVLIIGESEGFLEQGGIINFLVRDGKLRFEINKNTALKARLQLSAKLLQLAVHVTTDQ